MARKAATYEVPRHLVGGKIWNGEVYHPENQDNLPADFPQDGPWWNDYVPDEPVRKIRTTTQVIPQDADIERERVQAELDAEDAFAKQNDVTKLPQSSKRPPVNR